MPEQYRGKGIGIRLFKESLKKLKEKGATFYVDLVEPDNEEIIRVSEYLGFRKGNLILWLDKKA